MSLPDSREAPTNVARVETPFEADGELHLTEWPCRRGDKVEAIVLILEQPSRPAPDAERKRALAAAVDQFLADKPVPGYRECSPHPPVLFPLAVVYAGPQTTPRQER
jgi:hypothetical protein